MTPVLNTTDILPLLQTILAMANICIIGYGFYKFLGRPHNSLEERVTAHDVEIKEIKASLLQGNDRFREQDDTNEVLLHSLLALIEFEIQYCLTENKPISKDLEHAKDNLHSYLSKR